MESTTEPGETLEGKQLVYYDLETTGLGGKDKKGPIYIVQIGALVEGDMFSSYVYPRGPIEPGATAVTGLYMENDQLKVKKDQGVEVLQTVDIAEALQRFRDFLQQQEKPVVLIGHNIERYDNPILRSEAGFTGLTEVLANCVYGYIDTLRLFRDERPELGRYGQERLVKHYLQEEYNAHEAIGDVNALKRLMEQEFNEDVMSRYIRRGIL